jgi:hypothetical protein
MFLIQKVTDAPNQKQTLVLDNGVSFSLALYYRPLQQGWYINELIYGDSFTLQGIRVTNQPNMLFQFKNKIPFGLCCITDGGREPSQQQDFSSGIAKLYVLDADEVAEYTRYVQGGN